ncbi:MAG TPA: GTPase [Actinomycetes bacterium]|nr:GTPase [Actinomycetes bacterium]
MTTSTAVSAAGSSSYVATRVTASDLARRLNALDRALVLCTDRLDDTDVESARTVAIRAGERLRLSGEHTVVALAGATGSGKSSLFNAIAGLKLSRVGVRRPTTAHALACAWGAHGVEPLLDWLGIPRVHQLSRETVLDKIAPTDLNGLVLLDLPDHDSTEVEHRVEVERLVKLVDVLIWVMDPQKYADSVVHERYLRPLASHAAVTLIVFNQVDLLSAGAAQQCLADLKRLLAVDGLDHVSVLPTSAETGAGLADLRAVLAAQVTQKRAAGARLTADIVNTATQLSAHCGDPGQAREVSPKDRQELVEALAEAAGVPAIVDAVAAAHVHRASRATGWPVTKWIRRRHPDPLLRFHLDRPVVPEEPPAGPTTAPAHIQQAQLDTALRQIADRASTGLPERWAGPARAATRASSRELPLALDRAVSATDLEIDHPPGWWRSARAAHSVFFTIGAVGAIWLVLLAIVGFLQLPDRATPEVGNLPLPTLMFLGGALAGALLAVVFRRIAVHSGRRRAQRAQSRLHAAVGEVADRLVLAPLAQERDRYREACEHLAVAAHPDGTTAIAIPARTDN